MIPNAWPRGGRAVSFLFPNRGSIAFSWALGLLLTLDALILAAFFAALTMVSRGTMDDVPFMLRIGSEGSLPEIVGWSKWLIVALCLRAVWRLREDALARALSWVFAIVLADDLLQLHEMAGDALEDALGLGSQMGLAGDDLGEVVAWALIGIVVTTLLVRGFRRARRNELPLGIAVTLALAALIFCEIGLDMASGMIEAAVGGATGHRLGTITKYAEDIGAMMFGSLAAALAWGARADARQQVRDA